MKKDLLKLHQLTEYINDKTHKIGVHSLELCYHDVCNNITLDVCINDEQVITDINNLLIDYFVKRVVND